MRNMGGDSFIFWKIQFPMDCIRECREQGTYDAETMLTRYSVCYPYTGWGFRYYESPACPFIRLAEYLVIFLAYIRSMNRGIGESPNL